MKENAQQKLRKTTKCNEWWLNTTTTTTTTMKRLLKRNKKSTTACVSWFEPFPSPLDLFVFQKNSRNKCKSNDKNQKNPIKENK